ncbi:MAG: hypothetical protein ACOC2W_00430 [bacterium]
MKPRYDFDKNGSFIGQFNDYDVYIRLMNSVNIMLVFKSESDEKELPLINDINLESIIDNFMVENL